ncbi:hypothetical protein [Megalodesulfovibrio paquesii]
MAGNVKRLLALLGLGCLYVLSIDAWTATAQQLDFGRQARREAIQEAQRANLQTLLDTMGDVMFEEQQAQADREKEWADNHYVSPSGLSVEEEAARNKAARDTISSLIASYCAAYSGNSTETLNACAGGTVDFYDLPTNYQATFYSLFPEYDPSNSAYNRDVATLLGTDS